MLSNTCLSNHVLNTSDIDTSILHPLSETKEQKNGAMHSAIDSSWNFLFASATPPRQSSPRVPPLLDPTVLRLVSQASFTYKHVPPYSSINIANYTLLAVTHPP